MTITREFRKEWGHELTDYIRAFAGAYLFGVPLLFTMEMWQVGEVSEPWKMLIVLAVAFVVNAILSFMAGFKKEQTSFFSVLNQTIDALAVSLVASTVMLLALNQIKFDDPLDSILGKIVLQAIPLGIGVSLANIIFAKRGDDDSNNEQNGNDELKRKLPRVWYNALNDMGATFAGGLFIGLNIAVTDEVTLLTTELDHWHLLGVVALSLVISYIIVFASGFDRQGPQEKEGLFQNPFPETVVTYLFSLLVTFGMLLLFSQIQLGEDPFGVVMSKILILGLPVTIGGAAGRVAV
jgi:putative integral membrane protein (TIGR02587 family)